MQTAEADFTLYVGNYIINFQFCRTEKLKCNSINGRMERKDIWA